MRSCHRITPHGKVYEYRAFGQGVADESEEELSADAALLLNFLTCAASSHCLVSLPRRFRRRGSPSPEEITSSIV